MGITISGATGIDMGDKPISNVSIDNQTSVVDKAYVDTRKDISYKNTLVTITSWSYVGTTITLNVASHTFVAGDYIEVSGLTATTYPANGIQLVTSVTATTIVFTQAVAPTGTVGVLSATVKGYATINGRVSEGIGSYQTLQDVTASRVIGATYTNTSGKPIEVYIASTNGSSSASHFLILNIGSIAATRGSSGVSVLTAMNGIVPNGSTYSVTTNGGTPVINGWKELR